MRKIFIIAALALLIIGVHISYAEEESQYLIFEEDGHNCTTILPFTDSYTIPSFSSVAVDNAGNVYIIEGDTGWSTRCHEIYVARPNAEEPYALFATAGYDGHNNYRIRGIDFDCKGNMFCALVRDTVYPYQKAIIMVDGFAPATFNNVLDVKHPWHKKHKKHQE